MAFVCDLIAADIAKRLQVRPSPFSPFPQHVRTSPAASIVREPMMQMLEWGEYVMRMLSGFFFVCREYTGPSSRKYVLCTALHCTSYRSVQTPIAFHNYYCPTLIPSTPNTTMVATWMYAVMWSHPWRHARNQKSKKNYLNRCPTSAHHNLAKRSTRKIITVACLTKAGCCYLCCCHLRFCSSRGCNCSCCILRGRLCKPLPPVWLRTLFRLMATFGWWKPQNFATAIHTWSGTFSESTQMRHM